MDLTDGDRRSLSELSHRYASHVDDRDLDALGTLFTDDAVLVSGAGPRVGRAEILTAMRKLDRYDRTFHLVGQVRLWVAPDGVHGETYCEAHHFSRVADGTTSDHILYIRYHDTYALGGSDPEGWRFTRRALDIVATMEHPGH